MEALVEEFGHPTYTGFPVIVARLLMAALFGAVIGFEREWRNRPAGQGLISEDKLQPHGRQP